MLKYSTKIHNLHPAWISGFVDAEGSFQVLITKNLKLKVGWRVKLYFEISLHEKDLPLLKRIKNFFGLGEIHFKNKSKLIQFRIWSIKDLSQILDHFNQYPLITQKRADCELFQKALEIIERGEHFTIEGLHKLVEIKASINRGLSDDLMADFPNIKPADRPIVINKKIQHPYWLGGFTDGEGCFLVGIEKTKSELGFRVRLFFSIAQHARDEELLRSFIKFLYCGEYYPRANKEYGEFKVWKTNDITNKIIPFFKKYNIEGVKGINFSDWCKVAKLVENKNHLTPEGLQQIKEIKARMNTGRN